MVSFPVVEFTGHSVMRILIHSPYMSNHVTRYISSESEEGVLRYRRFPRHGVLPL